MIDNTLLNVLYQKNPLLIFSYLSKQPEDQCLIYKISKSLGLSMGSVHQILHQFTTLGLTTTKTIGRSKLYLINHHSPLVKSFRVFENLLELQELTDELKKSSRKIVLFGSCSRGEDTAESDIDLFIIADPDEQDTIHSTVGQYHSARSINPVILDYQEFITLEIQDPVFYKEVMKGIELWEVTNPRT